ncbi:MAG: hypothetical protein D6725_01165 [Planctomycetota bacterium]|nr:MAG: hypothetical protein D6725_01165 [Planctomycetota bacterium]
MALRAGFTRIETERSNSLRTRRWVCSVGGPAMARVWRCSLRCAEVTRFLEKSERRFGELPTGHCSHANRRERTGRGVAWCRCEQTARGGALPVDERPPIHGCGDGRNRVD